MPRCHDPHPTPTPAHTHTPTNPHPQDWLFIVYKRVSQVEYAILLATFGLVLGMLQDLVELRVLNCNDMFRWLLPPASVCMQALGVCPPLGACTHTATPPWIPPASPR